MLEIWYWKHLNLSTYSRLMSLWLLTRHFANIVLSGFGEYAFGVTSTLVSPTQSSPKLGSGICILAVHTSRFLTGSFWIQVLTELHLDALKEALVHFKNLQRPSEARVKTVMCGTFLPVWTSLMVVPLAALQLDQFAATMGPMASTTWPSQTTSIYRRLYLHMNSDTILALVSGVPCLILYPHEYYFLYTFTYSFSAYLEQATLVEVGLWEELLMAECPGLRKAASMPCRTVLQRTALRFYHSSVARSKSIGEYVMEEWTQIRPRVNKVHHQSPSWPLTLSLQGWMSPHHTCCIPNVSLTKNSTNELFTSKMNVWNISTCMCLALPHISRLWFEIRFKS